MHHYVIYAMAHKLEAVKYICYVGLMMLVTVALIFLGWTQDECEGKYDPWACNEGDSYAGNDDREISHGR